MKTYAPKISHATFPMPGVVESRLGSLARRISDRIVAAAFALLGYEEKKEAPRRAILPMGSGVSILPNATANITSRPQSMAFRPERVVIGGTPSDWIVNDIKVGNRSQFSQSGDVPGEVFAASASDSFVSFDTVQTAMDFVMTVTYVGPNKDGEPFNCGVLGTAVTY